MKVSTKALLLLVIPASAVGLSLGCKKHQHWLVMFWGISGLVVMSLAAMFGHDLLGEAFEKELLCLALCWLREAILLISGVAGPLTANNL